MDCGYNPNSTIDDNTVSMATTAMKLLQLRVAADAGASGSMSDELFPVNKTEFVFAGRILQRYQSGLHHRPQCVPHFSNGRHHHIMSLSVRRSIKILLNVPA